MRRFGQIIGVDPGQFEKYREYHAAVWPEVLEETEEVLSHSDDNAYGQQPLGG